MRKLFFVLCVTMVISCVSEEQVLMENSEDLTLRGGNAESSCNCTYSILSFNTVYGDEEPDYEAFFRSHTACENMPLCDVFLSNFGNRQDCLANGGGLCNYNVHDDSFPIMDLPFSCSVPVNSAFDATLLVRELDQNCNYIGSLGLSSVTFTVTCCEQGEEPIFGCTGGPCYTSDPITVSTPITGELGSVDLALQCNCDPHLD